jgi:hypothetical protein
VERDLHARFEGPCSDARLDRPVSHLAEDFAGIYKALILARRRSMGSGFRLECPRRNQEIPGFFLTAENGPGAWVEV